MTEILKILSGFKVKFDKLWKEELDVKFLKEYLYQQENYLEKLELSAIVIDFQ